MDGPEKHILKMQVNKTKTVHIVLTGMLNGEHTIAGKNPLLTIIPTLRHVRLEIRQSLTGIMLLEKKVVC